MWRRLKKTLHLVIDKLKSNLYNQEYVLKKDVTNIIFKLESGEEKYSRG